MVVRTTAIRIEWIILRADGSGAGRGQGTLGWASMWLQPMNWGRRSLFSDGPAISGHVVTVSWALHGNLLKGTGMLCFPFRHIYPPPSVNHRRPNPTALSASYWIAPTL